MPSNLSRMQKRNFIRLHKDGHSDRRIAKRLRITVSAVAKRRKKLGLPPNVDKEETSKLIKQAITDHLRRGGVSQGEKYAGVLRLDAAIAGWYGAGSMAQVRILDFLAANPGATQNQIRDSLGYKKTSTRSGGHNAGLNALISKMHKSGLVRKEKVGRETKLYAIRIVKEDEDGRANYKGFTEEEN